MKEFSAARLIISLFCSELSHGPHHTGTMTVLHSPHEAHSQSQHLCMAPTSHSASSILKGAPSPHAPTWAPLFFPSLPSSHAFFCSLRHLDIDPPQGLSPALPQISAGFTAFFLVSLCRNVSVRPPLIYLKSHPPNPYPSLTRSHGCLGSTSHHQTPNIKF